VITEVISIDVTQFTAQYELLRSQVIGARGDAAWSNPLAQPRGVGLALLLREGVPGWLKGVEAVIKTSLAQRATDAAGSPAAEPPSTYGSVPAWLSGVPRNDLTALLASLVLSTRPLQRCSSREEEYQSCQ
jgi:hypothetical protein